MEESPAAPKVTVLILSYNRADALRRCLAALEASQGRDQFEIIVVDNGSTDESPGLDSEFPGATFMRLPKNFGATKALNIGMRTAAGDFVFFLSTEVVVEPNTVTGLLAGLEADESLGGACPLLVDAAGVPVPFSRRLPSLADLRLLWRDPDVLAPLAVDPSGGPTAVEYPGRDAWMVRKAFVKALNWLDERYGEFGADLELAYQLRWSQRKIVILPSIRATAIAPPQRALGSASRALLSADRLHGVALFAKKHAGWLSGFKLRLGAIFHVLGQVLTFREVGFQLGLLIAILNDRKVDGTQRELDS
jgi:GT2 family glycosyltransferase